MSREIKFKAKRNGTWKIFELVDGGKKWAVDLVKIMAQGDNESIEFETPFLQFTGLKDKNGKDIYEGDLVQMENHGIREVVFRAGAFGFKSRLSIISAYTLGEFEVFDTVVIGNIHENPELLNNFQPGCPETDPK